MHSLFACSRLFVSKSACASASAALPLASCAYGASARPSLPLGSRPLSKVSFFFPCWYSGEREGEGRGTTKANCHLVSVTRFCTTASLRRLHSLLADPAAWELPVRSFGACASNTTHKSAVFDHLLSFSAGVHADWPCGRSAALCPLGTRLPHLACCTDPSALRPRALACLCCVGPLRERAGINESALIAIGCRANAAA